MVSHVNGMMASLFNDLLVKIFLHFDEDPFLDPKDLRKWLCHSLTHSLRLSFKTENHCFVAHMEDITVIQNSTMIVLHDRHNMVKLFILILHTIVELFKL